MTPTPKNPRLSTKDAARRNQADPQNIGLSILAAAGVLNPVVLLVVLFTVAAGQKKLRGWWVAAAGAVLGLLCALFGGVRAYFSPWRETAQFLKEHGGFRGFEGLKDFALSHAGAWISAQIPLGVAVGLLIAGAVIWKRGRFAAEWRDEEPELHTMSPREARAVNARVEQQKNCLLYTSPSPRDS